MNIKGFFSPLLFIVLGAAFLIVSAWAFFSNNNKYAIRYKYKIGGLILSLSFFASSCGKFGVTCYDQQEVTCYLPAQTNSIYVSNPYKQFSLDDSLFFQVALPTFNYYSILLTDSTSKEVFYKGFPEYSKKDSLYFIPLTIIPEDYRGHFFVYIYGEQSKELKQEILLFSRSFTLKPDDNEEED